MAATLLQSPCGVGGGGGSSSGGGGGGGDGGGGIFSDYLLPSLALTQYTYVYYLCCTGGF